MSAPNSQTESNPLRNNGSVADVEANNINAEEERAKPIYPFKYTLLFNERMIRIMFIRKVFSIVTIMLLVVAVMCSVPLWNKDVRQFLDTNWFLYWLALIIFLVVYIVLMCCDSVRKTHPTNIWFTGILTLSIGFMTMIHTAHYTAESVLLTLIITTICCASIICFSCQTRYDLTQCMGVAFILSMCLFMFFMGLIITTMCYKEVKILHTIYAGLAALLFMFYLAIDIQLIMGGRKHEISPDEYIMASITLFLDIVYIFWMLLSLFGTGQRN